MTRRKIRWYMISVLAYYRAEWTSVSDDDKKFRLVVTPELEELLMGCLKRKTSIPNAAKEVEIFLSLKPGSCGLCDSPTPTEEERMAEDEQPEGSAGENPPEGV